MLKTSAFVIKKNDYREFDRIYTVYAQDFGKISLLVRGARRIKSKLAPYLENFGEVRVNFAKGKIFNHLSGAGILKDNKILLKIINIFIYFYQNNSAISPQPLWHPYRICRSSRPSFFLLVLTIKSHLQIPSACLPPL